MLGRSSYGMRIRMLEIDSLHVTKTVVQHMVQTAGMRQWRGLHSKSPQKSPQSIDEGNVPAGGRCNTSRILVSNHTNGQHLIPNFGRNSQARDAEGGDGLAKQPRLHTLHDAHHPVQSHYQLDGSGQ